MFVHLFLLNVYIFLCAALETADDVEYFMFYKMILINFKLQQFIALCQKLQKITMCS